MNQALLHDSFDYHLQNEGNCESLDHLPSFSGQASPFEDENDSNTPNLFRATDNGQLNQHSLHPLSIHSTGSFEDRTPASQASSDISFQAPSGVSISASTSSRESSSTSPNSTSSSFSFLPPHSQYSTNASISYHLGNQSTAHSYLPAAPYNQSFLHSPLEVRPPRLNLISSVSSMPPPLRHPGNPIPVSPPLGSTLRGDYSSSPSRLSRHAFPSHTHPFHLSPSPHSPLSRISRSLDSASGRVSPASAAHFSFTSPMQIEVGSHLSTNGQNVPPFDPTESLYQLTDDAGRPVQAEIHAKIDKGFFRADQDWTCYRRNYFSVACSYGLGPTRSDPDHERIRLIRQGPPERIFGFYMCIAAKVDGEDGKPIELVQHTPKRDKGPMTQPEKRELKPNPTGNLGIYAASSGFGASPGLTGDYDASYLGTPQDGQNVATFDRIQFKKATANNGKRRAAQQYFHIVVELFVKIQKSKASDTDFVKVAQRVSAQMVVRGRSPGHYSDERRSSSTNMGPGSGPAGEFGGPPRDPSSAGSSLGSHSSLTGPHYSSRPSHGAYQTHHSSIVYSPSAASTLPQSVSSASMNGSFDHYVETIPASELAVETRPANEEHQSFSYHANTSYDSHGHSRPAAAAMTLASNNTLPTTFETTGAYTAMSSVKEEPYVASPPKQGEQHRMATGYGSLPLPAFGKWFNHQDHLQPPRDCRSVQLDTQRSYYTAAPAW